MRKELHIPATEDRGWRIIRDYSARDAEKTVARLAGERSYLSFDSGPGRRSAIIFDPTRIEVAKRNVGFHARDILYAVEQLAAEGYRAVGYDVLGNVYGLVNTEDRSQAQKAALEHFGDMPGIGV